MSQKSTAPISHLPAAPLSPINPTTTVPVVANSPARVIPAVVAGKRPLILNNITVLIDPTANTPGNVLDIINGASIPGVTASLDRNGQLNINGNVVVGGDAGLLQQLGLA